MIQTISGIEYAKNYLHWLTDLISGLDLESIGNVIEKIDQAREKHSTIFFMGNGGSAATANHFANDLSVCASPDGAIPIRALSLASNIALITCIGNDFGYDKIFVNQLKNLMRPGDVVIGISASGNSQNVIQALQYADSNGATSVAIVGFDGGLMKKIARHVVHVKSAKGEYGPVEDIHMILDHLISTYLGSQTSHIEVAAS